jgi:glycerol-3-phosphate acyltransferase PlsY
MLDLGLKVALSYLIGSFVGSLILGRIFSKQDIRTLGSGNAGATNAYRVYGKIYGVAVLLIDVAKGFIAIKFIASLNLSIFPYEENYFAMLLCGMAAFLGHLFPIWHNYKGGKGVATALGLVMALNWKLGLMVLFFWIIVLLVSKYVSVASTCAPLMCTLISPYFVSTYYETAWYLIISILIAYMHRSNFQRIRDGTEGKFL